MAEYNMFDKWDKRIDTAALANDVAEAANGGGGAYKEVPLGDYEVAVTKLELVTSKSKGEPMVNAWFKIVGEGNYKGSLIFMNQVVTQGFQIHIANEFLRAMVAECDPAITVEWKCYTQYENMIMDCMEAIDGKFEFALKYGKTEKGFNTFAISEVFPLED